MAHSPGFEAVGCDPEIYAGCAQGPGIESLARLQYEDIHFCFDTGLRFLRQF